MQCTLGLFFYLIRDDSWEISILLTYSCQDERLNDKFAGFPITFQAIFVAFLLYRGAQAMIYHFFGTL